MRSLFIIAGTIAAAAFFAALLAPAISQAAEGPRAVTEISAAAPGPGAAAIEEVNLAPTIGRSVHFTPSEACAVKHGTGPAAAIITQVHSETCVNLHVIWDGPETEHVTSVTLDESATPAPFSWRWPPRVA